MVDQLKYYKNKQNRKYKLKFQKMLISNGFFLAITDEIKADGIWIHGTNTSHASHLASYIMHWFTFSEMYVNYKNVITFNLPFFGK